MSKKAFKSQASSSRAFGENPLTGGSGFGFAASATSTFGDNTNSTLSWVYEPPDLSAISDPAVGVSLKNLQKRDSTTRFKALENLHSYVASLGDEKQSLDPVLVEAWAGLFPRTSIDNSNRVRQSVYALQGKIASFSGKAFLKHMPSTIGAWLAGTYDRDRQVYRAAQESINSTFNTEEKRKGVWKAFQEPILNYCLNAVQKETVQTLSDERTTSPDDAEAKYSRAISGAILTLSGLLEILSKEDLLKHADAYEKCLQSDPLWKLTSSKDSIVRKAIYRLAISATSQLPDMLDVSKLGTTLVKQCSADQNGSAIEFIKALIATTKLEPNIWNAGDSKRAPVSRLITFVGKGSFGIGSEFYKGLTILLQTIPIEVFVTDRPESEDNSSKIVASLRDGITNDVSGRREAEQLQPSAAWQCFIDFAGRVVSHGKNPEQLQKVINDYIFPIVEHYVDPDLVEEARNWPQNESIVEETFGITWKSSPESIPERLKSISTSLIHKMQASLPEQSKDFKKSQDNVTAVFTRWYGLQHKILLSRPELMSPISSVGHAEIEAAIVLLRSRNSKPYGAASVMELWMLEISQIQSGHQQTAEMIKKFCLDIIPHAMESASASIYLRLLNKLCTTQEISSTIDAAFDALLASPRTEKTSKALQLLTMNHWPTSVPTAQKLAKAVLDDVEDATKSESPDWSLPVATLSNDNIHKELNIDVLNKMVESLSVDDEVKPTIQGFQQLANQNSMALRGFIISPGGSELLSRLLYISHGGNKALQKESSDLRDAMNTMTKEGNINPITSIIKSNVLKTGPTTLPVHVLSEQANKYLDGLPADQRYPATKDLIPDLDTWRTSLQQFLEQTLDPAISIIDSLGGAVFFIASPSEGSTVGQQEYDTQGYSSPLRAAIFVSNLLKNITPVHEAEHTFVAQLYSLLSVTDLLVNDHLGLAHRYSVFSAIHEQDDPELLSTTETIKSACSVFIREISSKSDGTLTDILRYIRSASSGRDFNVYYHSRVYALTAQNLIDTQRLPAEFNPDQGLSSRLRKDPELFTDLASLATIQNSLSAFKLFNELISDLTSARHVKDDSHLLKFVALNILLRNTEIELDTVPKQRLVYFVKACVSSLDKEVNGPVQAETLKALAAILPALADIYDEFWESVIRQAIAAFGTVGEYQLVCIHAALQIYTVISKMLTDDPNEDLQEAWTSLETDVSHTLLNFLQAQARTSTVTSQPLRIVYDLLYRQLGRFSKQVSIPTTDMYPVMQSDSTTLHRTVYRILETGIAAAQEKVSLDAALSSEYTPKLPQALLSLLSETPEENETIDIQNHPELPSNLSRYLLVWKLVLTHWTKASYTVRAAYVAELKETPYVDQFLTLCFMSLIEHHGGRNQEGFDSSRIPSVTQYEINNAENPEMEYLWLLCNIYYNLSLHTPHLTKAWHTNSCPRALKTRVEKWTEKYISPLIIAEELRTVSEWTPPSDDPKSELTIKISLKASEITASLPLDETFMSIKVHLPPSYPLAAINLSTVQRVGIDEKKWLSYLNVSRIMMNFSSTSQGLGSVIDGISAWRNNTIGALKGHNECAICYSVVAEDGKVPNKKCAVCSNLFHGLCLYKWFQRSASSSCPLCRNAFNYA